MVKIYAANWILPMNGNPLQNYAVAIKDGKIFDLGPVREIESKYSNRVYDLGNSIIFPAFVNVHSHLELTQLRDILPDTDNLVQWMRETNRAMRSSSEEDVRQGILKGLEEVHQTGTIGLGEVTKTGLTVKPIEAAGLYSRVFHEVQGFRNFKVPYQLKEIEEHLSQYADTDKVTNHLSPHSVFTVGRKLFKEIEQRESIMTLHLASLEEELEFVEHGSGPLKQILLANEMFDYKWQVPETTPVRYFFDNYFYSQKNILVHMIHVSEEDMDYMAECHVAIHICLCPRAGKNLDLGVAPATSYRKRGFNLCLGTDNVLVSGDYDMRNEMRAAFETYQLMPKDILTMATYQGALALGFEDQIGSIEPGKSGQLLMMENPFAVDKDPYEAVLDSDQPIQWLDEIDTAEPVAT